MTDHDRGAYTPPTDDPLSFDARSPQRRRAAPVTLIASAVVLVGLVGAVFAFYQSGVRSANEPPRAVGTPVGAIKTAPVEDAKPVEPGALDVYVADDGAPAAAPTFVEGPEAPQARATPVEVQPAPAPPAKSPVVLAEAPTAAVPAPGLRPAQTTPPPAPVKVVAPKPAPAAPKPVEVAAAKPVLEKASGGGAAAVQIGAYSSTGDADVEFAKVRARFGSFTSGKAKRVEPVQSGGKTLYRTAFTGFSKAEAQAFCAALKAAGRDCIVK
jgi:hypothetical protein